jgi:hypothetical protein
MKKTVMKKWVRALRSGKFKQTKNRLKRTNAKGKVNHCCLGVLCELYNDEMIKNKKEKLKETTQPSSYDEKQVTHSFDGTDSILPKKVMNWSGLFTEEGEFNISLTTKSGPCSLSEMNDEGKRFTTIANFIEKNWDTL